MDEQGWLYFMDRTVDIIKHKGYRIAAAEIEKSCRNTRPSRPPALSAFQTRKRVNGSRPLWSSGMM